MYLERVTFTGADDSVDPHQLLAISEHWPHVEWGILVSHNPIPRPRFPSGAWIDRLDQVAAQYAPAMRLALHVCGQPAVDLVGGRHEPFAALYRPTFRRVQLNVGDVAILGRQPRRFVDALLRFQPLPFIFQLPKGLALFEAAYDAGAKAQALHDASGGAGVVPADWPAASWLPERDPVGYAGGLGPDTIREQLPRIRAAAGDGRHVWIDMEAGVRSDDGEAFSLARVRQVLAMIDRLIPAVHPQPPAKL